MREILFRGKTEDGTWVEGDLICNVWSNSASIVCDDNDFTVIMSCTNICTMSSPKP
jgi:hypothetical protein